MQVCKRCIMDSSIPNISFDSNGICSYCGIHDKMESEYHIGAAGENKIKEIVDIVKEDGVGKQYDCVVGISGGCDSSLLLYKVKQYGLRPLAVTFDNTWSTPISTQNVSNMCDKLDVDLHTHVVDSEEFNDISRSFLYASVPDADIPNDIAIAKLYYNAMEEYDINYSFCGHSFRTEGTVPIGWTYMDGKYIESVHNKFGKIPFKTYPNLSLDYWFKNLHRKRIRLLYYMEYNKEEVKKMLIRDFGWQWYGGHHYENEYTKFVKGILLPNKFKIDKRYVEYSALVRSGNMTRDEAIYDMTMPSGTEPGFLEYVLKRLGLTHKQFEEIMSLPIKSFRDYDTNHKYFVDHKTELNEMVEKGLIPRTFYEKYTRP